MCVALPVTLNTHAHTHTRYLSFIEHIHMTEAKGLQIYRLYLELNTGSNKTPDLDSGPQAQKVQSFPTISLEETRAAELRKNSAFVEKLRFF